MKARGDKTPHQHQRAVSLPLSTQRNTAPEGWSGKYTTPPRPTTLNVNKTLHGRKFWLTRRSLDKTEHQWGGREGGVLVNAATHGNKGIVTLKSKVICDGREIRPGD